MENSFEEIQMEEIVPQSFISDLDVKEWTMELRENNIIMDEYNVNVKEQKIKDIEEFEARQRQAREQEIEERQREISDERRKLEE